jgi:hypothetical protein
MQRVLNGSCDTLPRHILTFRDLASDPTEQADIETYMLESRGRLRKTWGFRNELKNLIEANPNPEMSDYDGGKAYLQDIEINPGYSVTSGSVGPNRKPASAQLVFYPKDTFSIVEMDHRTMVIGDNAKTNIKAIPSQLVHQMNNAVKVLGDYQDRVLYGDGSGVLAYVVSHSETTWKGAAASKVYIKPAFSDSAWYPQDAIKLIREHQGVEFDAYDQEDPDSAEVIDNNTVSGKAWGYEVVKRVKSYTADTSYIIVVPAITLPDEVVAGSAVVGLNGLNAEPIGLYGICGDGTVDDGLATMPRYGLRYYGGKDCQDDEYDWLKAPVFNLIPELHANSALQVTLSREVLIQAYQYVADNVESDEGGPPAINALFTSSAVLRRYMGVGVASGVPYFSGPAFHADLGITAPFWTAPDGKIIPLVTSTRMPDGDLIFAPFGDLMPALIGEDWDKGQYHGHFDKMLKYTGENVVRTTYFRYWFMVAMHRRAWMSIRNIKLTA